MLAFGMVAISIALDGLSGMGLGMALVVVLMVFGLASLASYWMHALRVDEPLFPPGLFRCARCAWACWAICSPVSAAAPRRS
jgi:hypothetical protein